MAGYDREPGKGEQVLEVAVLFDENDVVRGVQACGEEFGGFGACCGVIDNNVRVGSWTCVEMGLLVMHRTRVDGDTLEVWRRSFPTKKNTKTVPNHAFRA